MDPFELEIKNDFINEALVNLEETESSFLELETTPDTKPLLDKIFRLAHNLKGGSKAVGFADVAEFTHTLENLVLKIQRAEVMLSSGVISTLLRANDRLAKMLSELKTNILATFDNSDVLTEIKKWIEGENFEETATQQGEVTAPKDEPSIGPVRIRALERHEDEVVRVNMSKINILNDYVGELIVLQSVVQQQSVSSDIKTLQSSVQQMAKLSKDIQSISMSLRLLPLKPLIQKLQRVVRDTAHALHKDVKFVVTGEHIDVDKSVLDKLADPLIHILRNAVDHGLENSADRKRNDKPSRGTIELLFLNEGSHLIIQVKDDGAGIHSELVHEKAVEKKIIPAGHALTEKQLINLIFHPGFSTKSEISEISGRGVGMDVVKTNIESMGGQITVMTEVGKGSVFKIKIPLSLAVVDGLVVSSAFNRYVLPLSQIQETVNLKSQRVFSGQLGVGHCFELRGTVVPIFFLEEVLGVGKFEADVAGTALINGTALIINVDENLIALVVNDILRLQQIVIKPFSNGIFPQKGWVGTCILGDGLPTLIISPVDILRGRIKNSLSEINLGVAV